MTQHALKKIGAWGRDWGQGRISTLHKANTLSFLFYKHF